MMLSTSTSALRLHDNACVCVFFKDLPDLVVVNSKGLAQ
jgi:hypothetical protein